MLDIFPTFISVSVGILNVLITTENYIALVMRTLRESHTPFLSPEKHLELFFQKNSTKLELFFQWHANNCPEERRNIYKDKEFPLFSKKSVNYGKKEAFYRPS